MLVVQIAAAAPPSVTHFFPAGGQRGQTVTVTAAGKLDGETLNVWCSRDDIKIEAQKDKGKFSITIPAEAEPGTCFIRLFNSEGASTEKAFLIGTLPELLEKEPNNSPGESQAVESSAVLVNGVLAAAGDVDTFAVPLKKGQTFVASMTANQILGSPMDGILQVVSPRGFVVAQNDDNRGFDPQLTYLAESDGTYYVRTFAFPVQPNSSVQFAGAATYVYRLTLTTGPFIDHSVPMTVTRGKEARVRLRGWNIPPELQELAVTANTKDPIKVLFDPRLGNQYRIGIEAHTTAVEHEPNDHDRPIPIEVPTSITGRIDEAGDVDVFSCRMKKGERLVFRIDSRATGSPLDAVLQVFDAEGKMLRRIDDVRNAGVDPLLVFAAAKDGNYRVEVSDLYGNGGFRFVYCLHVDLERPNFRLGLAADNFTLTAEKPLEIPITVTRENRFTGEIELSAINIPDGVEAKLVKSLAKGATAKSVKLILSAKQPVTFNGPIRIVGRSVGEPKIEAAATAVIVGTMLKTESIWLTTIGKKPVIAKKPATAK